MHGGSNTGEGTPIASGEAEIKTTLAMERAKVEAAMFVLRAIGLGVRIISLVRPQKPLLVKWRTITAVIAWVTVNG